MSYEQIETSVEDGIMFIRLNRPDRMNAFTPRMMHELCDAYAEAGKNDDVRVVIVTGNGKAFCAGADLERGGDTFDYSKRERKSDDPQRDGGGVTSLAVFECAKPVIGALNGHAVGVGITMTLPMDYRIVSDSAKIGFVFAKRGIVPEACSTWFLPRLVGITRALDWCYSGRLFGGEEAKAAGLVNESVPADEVVTRAIAVAKSWSDATSPISVALIRKMMWQGLVFDHPMAAHEVETLGIMTRGGGDDAKEGVQSFLEKRTPQFPMKVSTDMPDWHPAWPEQMFHVRKKGG